MKSIKPVNIFKKPIPFVEGGNLVAVPYQFNSPVRHTLLTLSGPVVISAVAGTVAPLMAQTSPLSLWPYLLNLFGNVSFNGTRLDAGKGIKMNSVPAWFLWMKHFMETGIPAPVDDGGMLTAGFAPGTYNISVTVPIDHFDAKTPGSQQPFTYFRPVCYNKQPSLQIEGGNLFEVGVVADGSRDDVALTGETVTPASLTYDLSGLQVDATAYTVPDLKMSAGEKCADIAINYIKLFKATPSNYNNNNLADLEVQQYIYMLSTNNGQIGGSNTATQESGSARLGLNQSGIVETDSGTDPIAQLSAVNLHAGNVTEFMTAGFTLPTGIYILDEYGHNWHEWEKKTFLNADQAQHLVNANGTPQAGLGSNFRIVQVTANLSQSAKKSVGKFPPYSGL